MAPSLRTLTFGGSRSNLASPPSPTFSDTTNVSAMNFGPDGPSKLITRANLKGSLDAYEALLATCANYRAALNALSQAGSAFAEAMQNCSGLKGASYEAGTRLQAASGLHHLISNHWFVLADTLDKKFEKPLRAELENYRLTVNERSTTYERALRTKSQMIRDTELRSLNRKQRNLQSFREALSLLQRQVDDLDELKSNHYQEIVEHEEQVWDEVQGKVCLVVRSSMDVFDKITAKASDPVLEPMLQAIPDPFDSYGPPASDDQIFSILHPLSTLSKPPTPSPLSRTPEPRVYGHGTNGSSSGIAFPSQSSDWTEDPPSPTTPRSASPAGSPPYPRSSGSRFTTMSSIDENIGRHSPIMHTPNERGGTLKAPKAEKPPSISTFSWSSAFPVYRSTKSEDETPRHTHFPTSQSVRSLSTSPPPTLRPEKEGRDSSVPVAS